jgi:hypothetical protein
MSSTIQHVLLILTTIITLVDMKHTTTRPNTTRTGSYSTPSNFYIISAVLIGIIVLILIYLCINDDSRHIMSAILYWLLFLLVKIIMFIPAIVVLLYCYIYKGFVFIGKKIQKQPKIDIELQTSVVIDTTAAATTNTTSAATTSAATTNDTITDTIGFILYCYSWTVPGSGTIDPFSRNTHF